MAEDKKVVEALKEKLESISKSLWDLFVKFIITWGIPFDKLIHYFNHIKKDDLFGLVEGTHEIVKKEKAVNKPDTSSDFTKIVKVDRSRTPQEALDTTGRKQYTNNSVVTEMPRGEGDEVELVFFRVGRYVNDNQLEKEFENRGLVAADPYSVSALNEQNPSLADKFPHGTHWKDKKGKWCFAIFNRWLGERKLLVHRNAHDCHAYWWFVGLRKKPSES